MVSPSSQSGPIAAPPLRSTLSAKSTSSQASSSSQSGSTSRHSTSRHHPNLPPPPPADRMPPAKARASIHPNHQKLNKMLRKGKDKDTTGDLEDDWTLEGEPANGDGSRPRSESETVEIIRGPDVDQTTLSDSQLTEVPSNGSYEKKEKKGKGRSLVKKTSRLFSRDKSAEGESSNLVTPAGSSSTTPAGSRQPSYSSVTSANSQSTSSSSTHSHFATLNRPPSVQSKSKLSRAGKGHGRKHSQDSQTSWHSPPRTVRSGSSSTYDLPTEIGVPIPPRQSSQNGASVPGLSRHALPQPSNQSQSNSMPRSADTLPSRMSSWFSHLLPSNSTATIMEDSLTSVSSESPTTNPISPLRKPPSAAASFLNAARQRAVDGVRHLLDFEAQPDRCPDTIWVLGVEHPGWRSSSPVSGTQPLPEPHNGAAEERRGSGSSGRPSPPTKNDHGALRPAAWARRREASTSNIPPTSPPQRSFTNLFTASTLSLVSSAAANGSPSKGGEGTGADSPSIGKRDKKEKEVLKWPDQFYEDFRSRIWCTYRGQYAPIVSLPNSLLIPTPQAYFSAFGPPADVISQQSLSSTLDTSSLATRPTTTAWSWSRSAEERGLTSDAGWGCMLRTGQSLLANSLIHLHLGREWRLPAEKPSNQPKTPLQLKQMEDYAEYTRILTWFLDDPSPLSPFSVHRMALIGRELGKEVGEWFGPSTAAGALKTLANSFSPCRLTVATATDSVVYKSDVYSASNLPSDGWEGDNDIPRQRRPSATKYTTWGSKAVLILIGVRLGLDNVNSIYYESIKTLFTFPQSVGIAGGRPSSSYYFVGCQTSSLFYLDPHLTRPAVPLEIPPASIPTRKEELAARATTEDEAVVIDTPQASGASSPVEVPYTLDVVDVDDVPSDSDSSVSSSPSTRIRRTQRNSRAAERLSAKGTTPPRPTATSLKLAKPDTPSTPQSKSRDPFDMSETPIAHTVRRTSSVSSAEPSESGLPVDPMTTWYVNAYSETQLRTFHCEKVKKMPLSSLDPSMLLGFMCKDEADFEDFIERAAKLPQKIFTIQDEPPSWDDDDDAGLESVSEPDLDTLEGEDEDDTSPANSLEKRNSHPFAVAAKDDDDLITTQAVDITRQLGKMDVQDDDDDSWVGGSTPASQRPVLVESQPPTPTPNSTFIDHKVIREAEGESGTEREKPQTRQVPKHPVPMRKRTESWVDPGRDWEEAPNGHNLL